MPRPLLALALLFAVFASACDGKDCSEPPKPEESEERFVERVEGYLDDADASDKQSTKIVALAKQLSPARAKMRKDFEPHRTAILDQMLADTTDVAVIDREVEASADVMLTYADRVVDKAMVAHGILTKEQRAKMAEEMEEPPDPFELDWKADAAVEVFLLDIDATSAQKAMVKDKLVDVERDVRGVQKNQHKIRLAILPHIRSDAPDPAAIKALVRKGGTYSVAMIQKLGRLYVDLMKNLRPEQQKKAKGRMAALKRCPAS